MNSISNITSDVKLLYDNKIFNPELFKWGKYLI